LSITRYNHPMIMNVYKPKGWTSFDVVAVLRKELGIKKIGHAGTLDPLADGVLIILTEENTKKQAEFMHLEKVYQTEFGFNIFTESYDLEFAPKKAGNLTLEELKEKLSQTVAEFIGEIDQEVPMYSAVKVDGKKLYKSARHGETVTNVPVKKIIIKKIEVLELFSKEIATEATSKTTTLTIPVAKLRITCSYGTYIRALARDFGTALNTQAVMLSLVREKVGDYDLTSARSIRTQ
jgi:tRNA pseudouridine55 synthase